MSGGHLRFTAFSLWTLDPDAEKRWIKEKLNSSSTSPAHTARLNVKILGCGQTHVKRWKKKRQRILQLLSFAALLACSKSLFDKIFGMWHFWSLTVNVWLWPWGGQSINLGAPTQVLILKNKDTNLSTRRAMWYELLWILWYDLLCVLKWGSC